jgi:hypothetical protein
MPVVFAEFVVSVVQRFGFHFTGRGGGKLSFLCPYPAMAV